MKSYTQGSSEYAAIMNVRHYDTLKRLSIIDGEIYYDTGAMLQPIKDRLEMLEEDHNRPEYIAELEAIEETNRHQREHLRSM